MLQPLSMLSASVVTKLPSLFDSTAAAQHVDIVLYSVQTVVSVAAAIAVQPGNSFTAHLKQSYMHASPIDL